MCCVLFAPYKTSRMKRPDKSGRLLVLRWKPPPATTRCRISSTSTEKIKIAQLEQQLQTQLKTQLLNSYGIDVIQTGIERLTLPAVTLNATVDRMRAERETIAAERTAEGKRLAAEIHSKADRDARILEADASVKAAAITAAAQRDAASIYGKAWRSDPQLYDLLRSLDTLRSVVNSSTRIVLRTDAAPFSTLVQEPAPLKEIKR